ncbi:hypothetical protein D3C73_774160 [compost metagenome]
MGARCVNRFPVFEIAEHPVRRVCLGGKLQRQPTAGIGAQLQHTDVIERTALQDGPDLAGLVGQRQFATGLGVCGEGRGEGLADRADLEQCVFADLLSSFLRGYAVVKVMWLAVDGDRDRQAGDALLLHEWRDEAVDCRFNLRVRGVRGHAVPRAEEKSESTVG